MDDRSMPWDPLLLEVAVLWVHLPSGATAVQGVVRHPDGGPVLGGPALRQRPVGTGGTQVLFDGTDLSQQGRIPSNPEEWPADTIERAQQAIVERGWQVLTRAEAAQVLAEQGYRMRGSSAPGHILHTDQADEQTWHNRQGIGGRASTFVQALFVARRIRVPDSPAELVDPGRRVQP